MIIEGKIINSDSEHYGQVQVSPESGQILGVGLHFGDADIVTTGFIFPGFVDVHVHVREDQSRKEIYKEDYGTLSQAAIAGGVVAVADMPNNPVPPVDIASYEEKKKLASAALVDVVLYAGIGPHTHPLTFPVPYKAYLGRSVGEIFFGSKEELERKLGEYQRQNVSFHCEDPEILEANKDQATHAARRPREAEIEGIKFAIEMIKKFDLQGKICHLSTRAGLDLITSAKKQGLNITCEVTPHHLYFDESAGLQMNPPLRTKDDCAALIAGLKSGAIDCLATDHAPHTIEEREKGISGLPHLDTYGAFASWLMAEQGFSPQEIARVCSENPGRFVNAFTDAHFGRIEAGYTGSLTIMDPTAPTEVRAENLKTKAQWSPFEGITFPGRVTHTIIRGKVYEW